MNRRQFTKISTLTAVAFSSVGFVKFNGNSYVGDCKTTSDILGPFYRPNSPVRSNLVIEGAPGELVKLVGTVKHSDCTTLYKKAKVELWHCSADEIYDNDSDEFKYRGTTFSDSQGKYHFTTQMPVPYDAGGGNYRPAHFHMMISAPGYQNLVTQLYFVGDPYLDKDESSAHPDAKARVLDISTDKDGTKVIHYDIVLPNEVLVEPTALKKITGKYKIEDQKRTIEFFAHEGHLWVKNEVFGEHFNFIGNNTFEYPGVMGDNYRKLHFNLLEDGSVTATLVSSYNGKTTTTKIIKK